MRNEFTTTIVRSAGFSPLLRSAGACPPLPHRLPPANPPKHRTIPLRPLTPTRAARQGRDYYATVLASATVAAGPPQHPLDDDVIFHRLKLQLTVEQKPYDTALYLQHLAPLLGAIERRTRAIGALHALARRLERHSLAGATHIPKIPPALQAVLAAGPLGTPLPKAA